MCGIVGFSLTAGGVLEPSSLDCAVASMTHRGPDGSGLVMSGNGRIGLGHTRLSIIDPSETGAQPMRCAENRHIIVYNGEIYGFQSIREDLIERGAKFRGRSDTEVLLNALVLDGFGILPGLNGMFAFALWDREYNEITLVRDRFGIKPLYYTVDERGVFFASELRALLALGVTPGPIAPMETARYVQNLWNQNGCLPTPNLCKLEPGCAITIRDGRITGNRRWHSSPTLAPRHARRSISKTEQELVRLLGQSVERQLIADVPVGAFLSGGLDSSAIVALTRARGTDITCFTIDVKASQDKGVSDDLPYARKVAKHLGVTLLTVSVDETRFTDDLEKMVLQLEEPIADPACLNTFYISRYARECGIKVLLSGTGGDDLFSGYRRHQAARIDALLARLPDAARKGLEMVGERIGNRGTTIRRIKKFLEGVNLDPNDQLINYFRWTKPSVLHSLFSPGFRAELERSDLDAPMRAYLQKMPDFADTLDRLLALEQRFFLSEHNLLYTDKMAMATGVEVRVPFLDPDLQRFATSIPSALKQRRMTNKWIFKKAMEPYLPNEVIYRPKTGFGLPLRRWMFGALGKLADELLGEDTLRKRGLFDHLAVRRLRRQTEANEIDGSYTLFALMCVEIWCRNYMDNQVHPGNTYLTP